MPDALEDLLATLDLSDTGARTSEDIFTGISQWMPHGRVFGGQVLAQSLVAAQRTIGTERVIHSLHGYFLRAGDMTQPITFSVDRIHDGRSFATRRTQAYQDGLPIFSAIMSFQKEDAGLDHQLAMPAGLPEPESLSSADESLRGSDDAPSRFWAMEQPFEMRHISSPIYLAVEGDQVAHQAIWFKSIGLLPDDPNLHRAALAYASDYSILEPVLRRHGISWANPGLKSASLDHAMWWHRFGRVDEWMLYLQESTNARGGRGLSLGRIYSRDGSLLASVAQEGMVRVRNS